MSDSEHKKFGNLLAYHTAPTLLGIKCASLISLSINEYDVEGHSCYFNRRASVKGLCSRVMCSCGKRVLLLIYSEALLKKRLSDINVRKLLRQYGYGEKMLPEDCLERLSQRIRENDEFPHEIGLFLDYPVEDVVGFISNKGGNYKLCGCWKVYGCAESARRTFANYDKCRKYLCNKLSEGTDIYQALKI